MLSFLERNLDPRNSEGESGEASGDGGGSSSAKEDEDDGWVTVPDELGICAPRHPLDPHEPNFSELLPEPLRPYPSFEGWFIRIWDSTNEFSAALIMATNYATGESQVTILFSPGKDAAKHGFTFAVAVKTKVIFFTPL